MSASGTSSSASLIWIGSSGLKRSSCRKRQSPVSFCAIPRRIRKTLAESSAVSTTISSTASTTSCGAGASEIWSMNAIPAMPTALPRGSRAGGRPRARAPPAAARRSRRRCASRARRCRGTGAPGGRAGLPRRRRVPAQPAREAAAAAAACTESRGPGGRRRRPPGRTGSGSRARTSERDLRADLEGAADDVRLRQHLLRDQVDEAERVERRPGVGELRLRQRLEAELDAGSNRIEELFVRLLGDRDRGDADRDDPRQPPDQEDDRHLRLGDQRHAERREALVEEDDRRVGIEEQLQRGESRMDARRNRDRVPELELVGGVELDGEREALDRRPYAPRPTRAPALRLLPDRSGLPEAPAHLVRVVLEDD